MSGLVGQSYRGDALVEMNPSDRQPGRHLDCKLTGNGQFRPRHDRPAVVNTSDSRPAPYPVTSPPVQIPPTPRHSSLAFRNPATFHPNGQRTSTHTGVKLQLRQRLSNMKPSYYPMTAYILTFRTPGAALESSGVVVIRLNIFNGEPAYFRPVSLMKPAWRWIVYKAILARTNLWLRSNNWNILATGWRPAYCTRPVVQYLNETCPLVDRRNKAGIIATVRPCILSRPVVQYLNETCPPRWIGRNKAGIYLQQAGPAYCWNNFNRLEACILSRPVVQYLMKLSPRWIGRNKAGISYNRLEALHIVHDSGALGPCILSRPVCSTLMKPVLALDRPIRAGIYLQQLEALHIVTTMVQYLNETVLAVGSVNKGWNILQQLEPAYCTRPGLEYLTKLEPEYCTRPVVQYLINLSSSLIGRNKGWNILATGWRPAYCTRQWCSTLMKPVLCWIGRNKAGISSTGWRPCILYTTSGAVLNETCWRPCILYTTRVQYLNKPVLSLDRSIRLEYLQQAEALHIVTTSGAAGGLAYCARPVVQYLNETCPGCWIGRNKGWNILQQAGGLAYCTRPVVQYLNETCPPRWIGRNKAGIYLQQAGGLAYCTRPVCSTLMKPVLLVGSVTIRAGIYLQQAGGLAYCTRPWLEALHIVHDQWCSTLMKPVLLVGSVVIRAGIYLQQAGGPAYCTRPVVQYLNETCPGRWIGRNKGWNILQQAGGLAYCTRPVVQYLNEILSFLVGSVVIRAGIYLQQAGGLHIVHDQWCSTLMKPVLVVGSVVIRAGIYLQQAGGPAYCHDQWCSTLMKPVLVVGSVTIRAGIYLQQAGGLAYCTRPVVQYLNETCPTRWIGRNKGWNILATGWRPCILLVALHIVHDQWCSTLMKPVLVVGTVPIRAGIYLQQAGGLAYCTLPVVQYLNETCPGRWNGPNKGWNILATGWRTCILYTTSGLEYPYNRLEALHIVHDQWCSTLMKPVLAVGSVTIRAGIYLQQAGGPAYCTRPVVQYLNEPSPGRWNGPNKDWNIFTTGWRPCILLEALHIVHDQWCSTLMKPVLAVGSVTIRAGIYLQQAGGLAYCTRPVVLYVNETCPGRWNGPNKDWNIFTTGWRPCILCTTRLEYTYNSLEALHIVHDQWCSTLMKPVLVVGSVVIRAGIYLQQAGGPAYCTRPVVLYVNETCPGRWNGPNKGWNILTTGWRPCILYTTSGQPVALASRQACELCLLTDVIECVALLPPGSAPTWRVVIKEFKIEQ
ncbi:hypothetical protein PR048_007376 [Dryococelus australis]|uniref:Envelope glycoprotein n=1 Tax=Dryococelus australis TaxID=614101 RepID=A0ABQ9HU26_9NEOP|nr:hypothetical protein PR048_007376 [Dryococelus australis]